MRLGKPQRSKLKKKKKMMKTCVVHIGGGSSDVEHDGCETGCRRVNEQTAFHHGPCHRTHGGVEDETKTKNAWRRAERSKVLPFLDRIKLNSAYTEGIGTHGKMS